MTVSRRNLIKIGLTLPLVSATLVAYSSSKEEKEEFDADPCVIAHFFLYNTEVFVGNQALLSALVINRSREERECIVDLIVDNYVAETRKVRVPPLDFAYVNISFKPTAEGLYLLDVGGFQNLLVARAPPAKPPSVELPEELRKKFESTLPGARSFEEIVKGDKVIYKGYDDKGNLIGYVFQAQALGPSDRLLVTVAVSLDYKVIAIDVEPVPGSHLFVPDIATPKFEDQFKGLGIDDLFLKPEGKIDAVTMATYSSRAVVEAVRSYIEVLQKS